MRKESIEKMEEEGETTVSEKIGGWTNKELSLFFLSIEGGLVLGFITPFVVSINLGDIICLLFSPWVILFSWVALLASPQISKKALAITLFFAAIFPFSYALFYPLRAPLWAIPFWLPIVLACFLRWRWHTADELAEKMTKEVMIVLLLSSWISLLSGILLGMDPEGKMYIWRHYDIFLTGTQVFLLALTVGAPLVFLLFMRAIKEQDK